MQIISPFGLWKPPGHGSLVESPKGKEMQADGARARREARPPRGRSFRPQPEAGHLCLEHCSVGKGRSVKTPSGPPTGLRQGRKAGLRCPRASGWAVARVAGLATGMVPPPLERAPSGSCGSAIRGDGEKRLSQTQSTRNLRLQTTEKEERRQGTYIGRERRQFKLLRSVDRLPPP